MKKYDLEVANMLCNYFSELTGFELGGRGRTPKESYLRALLYRVLKDLNDMNDRAIARHFTEVVEIGEIGLLFITHSIKWIPTTKTTRDLEITTMFSSRIRLNIEKEKRREKKGLS